MEKVVTFGEIMLRLSTENSLKLSQTKSLNFMYGGGEFNVAVTLANFGIETDYVTKLPENEIGECVLMEMRKRNVGCQNVLFSGDRLGIYFLETGAGTRSSNVIYDRANSAMTNINKEDFDWEEILKDATWFHWSGITPAISESAAEECLRVLKIANKLGLTVSCDLNYRSKLWKYGKAPSELMPELLKYSNIILGDIDTACYMLGDSKQNPDYQNSESLPALYDKVFEKCPNLNLMATTLRYSVNASHQKIGGVLYHNKKIYNAAVREVTPVVDRVGSGDAFMGGLIYGLSDSDDKQRAIDIAVASCCIKHTIYGDYNLVGIEDINKFLGGENTGKISR